MTTNAWLAAAGGALLQVFTFGRGAVRRRILEEAAAACEARAQQHKAEADRVFRTGDPGAAMALAVEAEACAAAVRALARGGGDAPSIRAR